MTDNRAWMMEPPRGHSGGRRWCYCLKIHDVSLSEPRKEDSKKPWSPDPPTLRLHGAKNFWRRKKNTVGSVAYLHLPHRTLDIWGLCSKGEVWSLTPSSVHLFRGSRTKQASGSSLASLLCDSVSPSILQLRNGVNQDIPSFCRSCCKKMGPVSITHSICKALLLSQELCYQLVGQRWKDPILPLTGSVLSVLETQSRVISYWELCAMQETGHWVVGRTRKIQEGFLEEATPVLSWQWTANASGRNEARYKRCPFPKCIPLIAPELVDRLIHAPALRGMPSCSCPVTGAFWPFTPTATPNRI